MHFQAKGVERGTMREQAIHWAQNNFKQRIKV